MALIGFIRHGITGWNVRGKALGLSNQPLNDEGSRHNALSSELMNSLTAAFITG